MSNTASPVQVSSSPEGTHDTKNFVFDLRSFQDGNVIVR